MGFLDYIFPQDYKCIFCKCELPEGGICNDCINSLPIIKGKTCINCGGRVVNNNDVCLDCKGGTNIYDKGFCVFDYADKIQEKILKFKNRKYKHIGYAFAKEMLNKFKTINIPFDIIIPVPIHENRRRSRGFNQSEILCQDINDYYGRVRNDVLIRAVDTCRQSELNRANRLKNLSNAFKVTDKSKVKGKFILLVDDIYTTGSTINECAKVLKKVGAEKVYFLCLARTPIVVDNVIR